MGLIYVRRVTLGSHYKLSYICSFLFSLYFLLKRMNRVFDCEVVFILHIYIYEEVLL